MYRGRGCWLQGELKRSGYPRAFLIIILFYYFQGDGGSPLVCKGKLIGIVSYGYGCGNTSQYTIHTDIRKHYQWVKENECTSLRPIWTFSLLLTVLIFM